MVGISVHSHEHMEQLGRESWSFLQHMHNEDTILPRFSILWASMEKLPYSQPWMQITYMEDRFAIVILSVHKGFYTTRGVMVNFWAMRTEYGH